uniref:Sperm flagellar 2 n=1 Tax=Mastacembelus armatus TaxID=205130 RepID=A0A3Q3M832_9TELE
MSDILCRWLNQDLRLSKIVEPKTFAKDFSSGYLIGEVLHKYQLQNDFSMFMKKDTSISRLNNFTRLEPTLQLLGISFDINTAQELMQEKQGVATRLLYHLYISLEKKKSTEISGTMMEIMLPAANAELHKKEHDIYSDRLHQVVKRDAELKLQKISQHYEKKFQQLNEKSVVTHSVQQKRQLKVQHEKRMKNIEKRRVFRQKHSGIMSWIQATAVQVPRPPPNNSQLILKKRLQQQQRRQQQAQVGQSTPGDFPFAGTSEIPESGTKMILQSSSKYIEEIRQRLEENAVAREQREKRRDRFLVEQLKAHEAQEEARREEQLVKRLTRQTQQEQRLAAQLLQIRMQKEVIRENRLFREQQYQQRRERDFQEALAREAALAQQAKLDHAEEIRKEVEFFNRIAAERAQRKYQKHFKSCKDILDQIVDLATKVGEYRLLTGNLIPEKLMREWKELLFSGLPLYEPIIGQQPGFEFSSSLDPLELKKQETLNNQDYDEYTNMVDEWAWPEEEAGATTLPPTNNNILGHIIQRLRNIVHPPVMEPSSPSFPHFTLKACVLGKFCSGKTTCLAKIAKGMQSQQTCKHTHKYITPLSTLAMQGAAAEKELRNCSGITNELLVGIIVEAIRQLPAHSGWILDGFPVDITQAYLLEKALGGSVDIGNDIDRSRTNLAADPNPPKPPLPAPVLDLALLLDIPDESVITRAFNHTGGCFILCICVYSSHPTDKTLYLAQIPHRITAFQDTWPKLEKWFGEKQNILVYVDASVDEEELYRRVDSVLQHVLMQTQKGKWSDSVSAVCVVYTVMQQLRSQHTDINHHLFNIREKFKHFLHRPDLKQELVSQWQNDFNSIADDMREDEDTKADLHVRLDELRERLWDISDKRKEQDQQTRADIMGSGWLEEHTALLIKHHSTLMKVELDRFQETLSVLRVYYMSMYKPVLPEPPSNFNAAKVRIAVVKGHGLKMLHSLKSRAEQTFSSMEEWLEAHYLAEMKGIDQLSKVVQHHIEAGNKLQNELVLTANWWLVSPPPPHPPPLEKPSESTLTITQLESLHQQLSTVAPSGLIPSSEFSSLLRDIISVNRSRNTLPELWINKNETQWMEIVYLLTDDYELIDWRRFLLSAALPWPVPSLSQLLVVLRHFKAADPGKSGYINEKQYLQTELWFSFESVQPIPEDPSEPPPYDRLANLHKFFFQLFADHSISPPQLDYVSMLQYFAADPNPRQGFIRALCVALGKHLKHSSPCHLVKSMPRIEEASELDSSEVDGEYKEEETQYASQGLPGEQEVSIPVLLTVIGQNIAKTKDSDPHLVHVFRDLGYKPEDCVPFSILCQHPFIQSLMETSTRYQLVVRLICLFRSPTTVILT